MTDQELFQLTDKIRYELTAAQTHLTTLRNEIAKLKLPNKPERPACPECGLTFPGPRRLAEHLYQIHDGPTPDHWLELEQKAAGVGEGQP